MSESTSDSSGMTAAAPASDGSPATHADILVPESPSGALVAGAELADADPVSIVANVDGGEKLGLGDVLLGVDVTDPNLGAYLKVEPVGSNTVISVDVDGTGLGAAVPIATLEGVAGITLQQLLNSSQVIT
ncbi:MAG: type I secretion C-terminal target domain-containing protein [Betaproteobacteria bacterium]|nr:type I secretion C-terminal target domain-containing protein [Betaproteobacteria bacterium]